jgi:hypothetical protein
MAGFRGPLLAANAAFLTRPLFVYFWLLMEHALPQCAHDSNLQVAARVFDPWSVELFVKVIPC